MAYGKGGNIFHKRLNIATAGDGGEKSLVIPPICYDLRIQVRPSAGAKIVRVHLKRDPKVGETPVYANEVADDGDYISLTAAANATSKELVFDNIRFIDKYVLWVQSTVADTDIEVTYIKGY